MSSACPRLMSEDNGELVFNGDRVSVWEEEKVREVRGVDDRTTT